MQSLNSEKEDTITPKRALISVFDKTGVLELASVLVSNGCEILSTGGTAKTLRDAGIMVVDVSDYTGSPEILSGRVKTLHPKIHGGLLAIQGSQEHTSDLLREGIQTLDVVVVNLYPFEQTVRSGAAAMDECIEKIDIGGNALLRSGSKNYNRVAVLSSPSQYALFLSELSRIGGTTLRMRQEYAASAFSLCSSYDTSVAAYFASQMEGAIDKRPSDLILKYGCNPHQRPAFVHHPKNSPDKCLPFSSLNGKPGYINLLDALNGWQLVKELREALGTPAAASFKHCSPAGAAVALPLSDTERLTYCIDDSMPCSPLANAYIRARNADPLCSFGDFVALSDVCDVPTAHVLRTEVCDGVIAPGFEADAFEILRAKKKGAFIVLQIDPAYEPEELEFREVYGVGFSQPRNNAKFSKEHFEDLVTSIVPLPDRAKRDLLLASVVLKYTQSNSVGYAINGQMIGVGAGQQSRVDCVKLAGRKARLWYLRQHKKVLSLPFKSSVKRQNRINARVRYIEDDFTGPELTNFLDLFERAPPDFKEEEKQAFMHELTGVSMSSDAFFPFRDSIDHASKLGVKYICQPGGSVADEEVKKACSEYGMSMVFSGVRLFHH